MKSIKIKSLHLCNWRGAVDQQITFYPHKTIISGANGTGKSTIMNAFLWLLFGKDQIGRKDFNIKRISDGSELRRTDAIVEGTLEVDGVDITLRRALIEEWVKPRGQVEEVYKGNRTEYHYNGVSITQREYNERISAIVPENIFYLITDPDRFISLKWQEQRELLFAMAGDIDEEGIIDSNPAFAKLLDDINQQKTTLADERKRVVAQRKKVKEQLDEIPIRIGQTKSLMPATLDWDTLEARRHEIAQRLSSIETLITSERAREEEASSPQREALDKLKRLESERDELCDKLRKILASQEEATKRTLEEATEELAKAKRVRASKQDEVQDKQNDIRRKQMILDGHAKYRDELIAKFSAISQEAYASDDVCPSCHQPLPEEIRQEARKLFAEDKKRRLDELNALGLRNRSARESDERELDDLNAQLAVLTEELSQLDEAVKQSEQKLENTHRISDNKPELPDVAEMQSQIDRLTAEVMELEGRIRESQSSAEATNASTLIESLKEERSSLLEEDSYIIVKLSSRKRIDELEQEIAQLESQGRSLAETLASIEHREDLITAYNRARTETIKQKINSLFTITSWKLFDTTIDGGEIETCVPLVDGVPHPTANTASQVNACLDIIGALSKHYGATAPIFIDGAERINKPLSPSGAQIILLTVTEDEELVIS